MIQRFKCKEPGCEKEIVYEYSPVDATVKMATFVQSTESEVIVYLTCEEGHTHPYKVKVSK